MDEIFYQAWIRLRICGGRECLPWVDQILYLVVDEIAYLTVDVFHLAVYDFAHLAMDVVNDLTRPSTISSTATWRISSITR